MTQPLSFGSHKSRLIQVLREGPCADRVNLSPTDWQRLVTWIDANAPYHDQFVNKRLPEPAYSLPNDQEPSPPESRQSIPDAAGDVTSLTK